MSRRIRPKRMASPTQRANYHAYLRRPIIDRREDSLTSTDNKTAPTPNPVWDLDDASLLFATRGQRSIDPGVEGYLHTGLVDHSMSSSL